MKTLDAKIIRTYDYSLGFNDSIIATIDRKQYLNEIEEAFNENQIVFLKGDEGSGKTVICQEFTKKYDEITISIFFNPNNKIDYSLYYFFENVINQICFKINEEINEEINIERYRTLLSKLRQKFKGKKIYFVIDGLSENLNLIKEISEYLTLGQQEFKYLITGSENNFKNEISDLKKLIYTSINVVRLSIYETKLYLGLDSINKVDEEEIYKHTKGLFSRLFVIKRQFEKGVPLSKIIESDNYKEFIKFEIEKFDLKDENIIKIFSLISLSPNKLTIKDLSNILENDIVDDFISKIDILKKNNDCIEFISNSYKKFIAEKYKFNQDYVDNSLIKLLDKTTDLDRKIDLIKLLNEKKNWSLIDKEVNDELLIKSFKHTGSLNKINSIINIGNNASNHLNQQDKLIQLSLKGSFFNYLQNSLELISDVETKLAFKDYTGAFINANKAIINTERLRLYCLIAKKQKKDNKIIEENLLSDIETLFKKCDFSNSGDLIYDIISDMIYIDPSLALKIIDNSDLNDSNINDMIVSKLSIMSMNNEIDNDKKESSDEKLDKFKNTQSRKISRALSLILGDLSIEKLLIEIDKVEDSIEKIKLLRLYIENIKNDTDGIELLIDKTFQILLSTNVNNLINLEILTLLSSKISTIKSEDLRNEYLKKLYSIDKHIIEKGLFVNKIKYKLNIFKILYLNSPDKSYPLLDELIKEIDLEKDILIKTESHSQVYKVLHLNKEIILKNLKSKNYNLLNKNIDILLLNSANQYMIFKNILKSISSVDIEFAISIAQRLNVTISRDKYTLFSIENHIDNNDSKKLNLDRIIEYLDLFNEFYYKNLAIVILFEKFSDTDSINLYQLNKIKQIYFTVEKEFINENRIILLNILLFKIFKKNSTLANKDLLNVKNKLKKLINNIPEDWTKYEIVNNICSELTEFDINFTREIYSKTKNIKDRDIFYSEIFFKSYLYNLEYLIFTLDSLIEKKADFSIQLDQLLDYILKIPSDLNKLNYLSKIGFLLFLKNHTELNFKILEKYVYPILTNENINLEDTNIIIYLYINDENYAKKIINKFSYHNQNEAYLKISLFYLECNNPYKIYDDYILINKFSYGNLYKSISVLKNINRDVDIYKIIEKIVSLITNKETSLNNTQTDYILNELEQIIESKLPDKLNIQHEGYKIICYVQLNRVKKDLKITNSLIDRCNSIVNISDRIYVKSLILKHLINKQDEQRKLFDEIIEDLDSLNINYEYIERINEISEIMYSVNNSLWKKVVKTALTFSNNLDDKYDIYRYQRNLIDTIHKIDEKLCNELIESVDCLDKIDNKNIIKKHLSRIELLKKVKNNQTIEEKEKEDHNNILYAIFNSVKLLNSGKITPKKVGDLNKIIDTSYKIPIDKSIILYMYYFQNISMKIYSKTDEENIKKLLIDDYNDAIKNFDFLKRLHIQNFQESKNNDYFIVEESNNVSIEIGEREKAKSYIKDWILNQAGSKILIIDSYFGYDDLELLKLIITVNNDIEFNVLANKTLEKDKTVTKWKEISSQDMPNSEFIFASKQDGTSPFHDRYIFSIDNKKALRLGTSYNQMGIKKTTEISKLEGNDYGHIYETIVKNFIIEKNRLVNKERINYDIFQF